MNIANSKISMKFKEWFESQYGPRPAKRTQDKKLKKIEEAGWEADYTLRQCEKWDLAETAALYAWQAAGKNES